MKRLFVALAAALFIIAVPVRAQFNQTVPVPGVSAIGAPTLVEVHKGGGVINIGQAFGDFLQPYVDAIANALVLALVGYLANELKKKWNIEVDKNQRDALTTFLQNQAGSLIADGMVKVEGAKVNVDSTALASAANQVERHIPDAAKHFGLTPELVAAKIVDTIPQIAAGAHMLATSVTAAAAQPALTNVNGKPLP